MKRKRQRKFIQIAVVVIAATTTIVFGSAISRFVAIRNSTHFNRTSSVVTLRACTNVLLYLSFALCTICRLDFCLRINTP